MKVAPSTALAAVLVAATALLTAPTSAAAAPPTPAAQPDRPLRDLAGDRLLIGTAVDHAAFTADAVYRDRIATEFSSITAENVMKWEVVEPERGRTDYTAADELVAAARANGQRVRGHTLLWHNQLPAWLTTGVESGEIEPAELRGILREHILDEVGHFRGKIYEWDVVNEVIDDEGNLRDTLWLRELGPGYIADAFRWAHQADPRARLFLNDYNVEGIGAKSDAYYRLAQDLLAQRVPVHGFGAQGHYAVQFGFHTAEDVAANFRRFEKLGLRVAVTEADVRMIMPPDAEKLAAQARGYGVLLRGCLLVSRCTSFTVWGFTDKYSWVPGFFEGEGAANLLDESFAAKPAYREVQAILARPTTGGVDFAARRQSIDGFGFAQAFQRAAVMNGLFGLTPDNQREVLDLLLDRRRGAGLSILRLGIGSSPEAPYDLMKSIQPVDPGGPTAPPRYEWDGYDGGQVWLAKQAAAYGVRRFYADAWSAPGYMKTNGVDTNGGRLCGVPGTDCASGDWRQAYANYLVRYAKFYAAEGVRITDLGFTNEPDLAVSYASMQFDAAQAVDFIRVLGPTVARSGLAMNVVCCDAAGWTEQEALTKAIEASPAARWVDVHTGHPYVNPADRPLPTRRPVWMSEWQPNGDRWTEAWDDGTAWSGIVVAQHIHDTLTTANANAYVYWFGASIGATRAFVQLDGPDYHVAKRLWAMAAFSRFIRPGAVRVSASVADPAVRVTAFRNTGGSRVVELLNTGPATRIDLRGVAGAHPATYLTDETHSLTRTDTATVHRGLLSAGLPARSLTTVVLS